MAQDDNIELARPVVNQSMWKYWKAALRDEMMEAASARVEKNEDALILAGQMKAFSRMHDMIKTVDSDGQEE